MARLDLTGLTRVFQKIGAALDLKLGKNETAMNSMLLNGQPSSSYAPTTSLADKLDIIGTAYDSSRLGGVLASGYATTTLANSKLPLVGGTLTGRTLTSVAMDNTAQFRNIVIVAVDPGEGSASTEPDGTIVIYIEET